MEKPKKDSRLDVPGAGISPLEMWFLNRVLKPLGIRNSGVKGAVERLKVSALEIERILKNLTPAQLQERVLVKRPWFVEDSSRNWSAALLCRHLAIVDGALGSAIEKGVSLKAELLPKPSERVAAVKPEDGRNDLQALMDFKAAVEKLALAAGKHPESELARRIIPHPWLGDISHLQWIWFAAFHHQIHLRQLKRIVRGLPI